MLINTLQTIYDRDLKKLVIELNSYQSEERIWKVEDGISNSAGNLCLHLIGNLKAFIGSELGQISYIRHRDQEFSLKNIPRTQLLEGVEETRMVVQRTLLKLTISDLEKEYPINVFGEKMSTGYFLVHLSSHLSYHLGQINYHRRLLDKP